MKSASWERRLACAAAMGVLTLLCCLVLADGILGIQRPGGKNPVALWVFWFCLVSLPVLFYPLTKWRDSLWNLPLYFLLYFPLCWGFGPKDTHYFLASSQFLSGIFPVWADALAVALLLWGVQSLVYLLLNGAFFLVQQIKRREKQ